MKPPSFERRDFLKPAGAVLLPGLPAWGPKSGKLSGAR
jgi:hypothetical protein